MFSRAYLFQRLTFLISWVLLQVSASLFATEPNPSNDGWDEACAAFANLAQPDPANALQARIAAATLESRQPGIFIFPSLTGSRRNETTVPGRIASASEPFTTASVITRANQSSPGNTKELFSEFQKLVDEPMLFSERSARLAAWVKSPDHANYVIEHLEQFKENAIPLLKTLLEKSPHFGEATPVDKGAGSLVTYAYDVEGAPRAFVQWFKIAELTDEAWNQLTPEVRAYLLLTEGNVCPTKACPPEFAQLKWEDAEVAEIAHRALEISLERALSQLDPIAKAKGSADGNHVHLVSEFPKRYPHLPAYAVWGTQKNDVFVLKNLESARFPESFVNIGFVKEPEKNGPWDSILEKNIPMGMRPERDTERKWGTPVLPDHIRVSHEVRGTSDDLEILKQQSRKIAGELKDRPWEREELNPKEFFQLARIVRNKEETLKVMSAAGLTPAEAEQLFWVEPLSVIPLIRYENQIFYDFDTNQRKGVTPISQERVRDARNRYLTRLRELMQNYPHEIFSGSDAFKREDQDYQTFKKGIRARIVHWAWLARVSELFPEGTQYPRPPVPEALQRSARDF